VVVGACWWGESGFDSFSGGWGGLTPCSSLCGVWDRRRRSGGLGFAGFGGGVLLWGVGFVLCVRLYANARDVGSFLTHWGFRGVCFLRTPVFVCYPPQQPEPTAFPG